MPNKTCCQEPDVTKNNENFCFLNAEGKEEGSEFNHLLSKLLNALNCMFKSDRNVLVNSILVKIKARSQGKLFIFFQKIRIGRIETQKKNFTQNPQPKIQCTNLLYYTTYVMQASTWLGLGMEAWHNLNPRGQDAGACYCMVRIVKN